EEDDKQPETTVTVEEVPVEEEQHEEIQELPEEVRVVETETEDGKPKKKKIRTRVIKKVKGDKQEITKIETVEEEDKKPQTTITVEEADTQITEIETIQDNGELSRNIEEADEVLKKRPKKFKHTKPVKAELEELDTETFDDKKEPLDEPADKSKYQRGKKDAKEKDEKPKKLKIGKGKIPETVESTETVELKPVIFDEGIGETTEKPKEKPKQKKPSKMTKPFIESDDNIRFNPSDEDTEEKENQPTFKFEVIELEPEEVEDETSENVVQPVKEPKRKRKLKLKTELEENIIEIVEVPSSDNNDKQYEVTVTSSELKEEQPNKTKILKKKIKRMNKEELDEFVADLKEEPDQTFYETAITDFYEVKLTELEAEETSDEILPKKTPRRKILHKHGDKEELLEIVETLKSSDEEPLYEVTITSLESEKQTDTENIVERPKQRTRKMKKDDLDAYIQQLINAEIPTTELEKYEKIDIDAKPKKPKKHKSKQQKAPIDEGEAFEVGITQEEPAKKLKVKKPKPEPKVEEEIITEPETVIEHDEFTISTIDTQPVAQQIVEETTDTITLDVDDIITDIGETLPIIVLEEQTETTPESTEEANKPEAKIVKRRKVKTRKGSKQYEIEIVETQEPDDHEEAKVTVITTEIVEECTDVPNEDKPEKPKKIIKKVKKDKLKEYIVKVVDEVSTETLDHISEEVSTVEEIKPIEDDDIISFKTTVVDDISEDEFKSENELVDRPTPKSLEKKKKSPKPKKVTIIEEQPVQIEDIAEQEKTPVDEDEQIPQIQSFDNHSVEITESAPKPKKKIPKKKSEITTPAPISEHTVRIEEFAPETITEEVINEQGEEVERTTTKRRLKKKEGPKEYLIEVVETYEENNPEAELVIQTTEILPESETETPKDHKVKVVKKKKPKTENLDNYIQKLIEEEIPKTELEVYETAQLESSPETKEPKKIKKHHKKITEIIDGVPHTIHEFTIQEFEPEETKPIPESVIELVEEDISESQPEDLEVKPTEEQSKRKPKKEKKSKVSVVDQEPVSIEDIAETVEITKLVEDGGATKEVQVKKRKIIRKQGPKQHVFEITETSTNEEPLAEVTIVDITEDEKPSQSVKGPSKPKPIKLPTKLRRDDVESYVINVVEEFVEPIEHFEDIGQVEEIPEGDYKKVTQVEEIPEDFVEEITEDKTPKIKTKTTKPKKPKKPEDHTIRIEELAPETTIEDIVNEEGEEVKQVKTTKRLKKKEGPKEYLIEITETYQENKPDADIEVTTTEIPVEEEAQINEEQPAKVVKKLKQKKAVKDDLDKYIQELIEQEITKTDLEQYEPTEMETKPKPQKKVKAHHKKKVEIIDGLPVTVHEYDVSEIEPGVTEEDMESVILEKPEELPLEYDEANKYLVSVLDEIVEPMQTVEDITDEPTTKVKKEKPQKKKKVEKAPIVLDEIAETTEVIQQPSEDGVVKEVTVKKRKVTHRKGSKQSVFEITETTSDDQPMAEVTVAELTEIEPSVTEETPIVEQKVIKKTKKLKKEDIQEYVINVIDDFVQQIPVETIEEDVKEIIEEKKKKTKKSPKEYKYSEEENLPETAERPEGDMLDQSDDVKRESPEELTDYTVDVTESVLPEEKKPKKSKKQVKSTPVEEIGDDKHPNYLVKMSSVDEAQVTELPDSEIVILESEDVQITEEPVFQVEEIETNPEIVEETDELGETSKKVVNKRKIRKQVGPKEEIIEIVETEKDGIPVYEVSVTLEEAEKEIEETLPEEKPKKVKKTKKVPKDDLHDYIQKLIEQDIPKSELEKYEKIDFDEPVKMKKKKPVKKVTITEEEVPDISEKLITAGPEDIIQPLESPLDESLAIVTVKEFAAPTPKEKSFEITVLEEFVENKPIPDEEGEIKVKEVKTKKIKHKKGPEEIVHDITVVEDKDTGESEITIVTSTPNETEDQHEVTVKQKRTKKVKKNDVDDFIRTVIEEDIPKEEPTDVVDVTEELIPEQVPEKPKKVKKKEKIPLIEEKPTPADTIDIADSLPEETPIEEFTMDVEETTPIIGSDKEHEISEEVIEPRKKKKPSKQKVKVSEEQPQEDTVVEALEVKEKETDIEVLDVKEYSVTLSEEEPKPEEKTEKKPKKIKEKPDQPDESAYEISVKESYIQPEDLPSVVEIIESETKAEETTDAAGEVHKVVTTKRKIKRPKGENDEIVEIIEVVTDDQPDAEITIVEYEPVQQTDEEKPKAPKKKTKKVKKDDIHDYIQKLIDMETPKTELEKYEKIEFEPSPKEKLTETTDIDVVEESPAEKPKKDKKSKPKESIKEEESFPKPLAEVKVIEEDVVDEPKVVEVVEIQPEEVQYTETITEEGLPVQEKTTKRVLKKKGPKEDTTFKITTVESENTDTVTVIVDEEPEITPESIETKPDEILEEKPKPKPKPKKIVKKVKKDDLDDYVKKLIEEEIPKTEKEVYEKVEMPEKSKDKSPREISSEEIKFSEPETPLAVVDSTKPKKTKTTKPKLVDVVEQRQDEPTEETIPETLQITEDTTTQIAHPEDTATAQITPSAQDEIPTQDDTKDTVQKTVKHKKAKPDTVKSVETSEAPEAYKDYHISIIDEEPEEKEEQPEKILEVRVIDEVAEIEESQPIVEEEEEDEKPTTESNVEDVTKPKTKKKKVVKKKTNEHDELIQKLLEQEIEKTELEKYEKIDFDVPKKLKPEFASLEPMKIERKEQKPTKVTIVEATDVPKTVKLKPGKRKEKPAEEQTVQLPKFRLKTRMVLVEYPPAPLIPKLSHIGAVKQNGDLSRNIEEAEELLKFKPHKTKKIKKIKDDLEKVELEKYEKYVSSEEEPEEKQPYQKPEKVPKPEESPEDVKLKIGKGKKKPKEEESPENVTLKKIPQKPKEAEEEIEAKPKEKAEVTVVEQPKAPREQDIQVEPFEPVDYEHPEYVPEELEQVDQPEKPEKQKKPSKSKYKPKEKTKPEPETIITEIVPGKPKEEEEVPEAEIKFRKPESEAPEETDSQVKLKPFKKTVEEPVVEDTTSEATVTEPTTEEQVVIPQDEVKKTKKSKPKPKQQHEEEVTEEQQPEFEISVKEEEAIAEKPEDIEKPKEVKVKQKKPKEAPKAEVDIIEELPQPTEAPEDIPVEYRITTTVLEPEEAPKEHQVKVIDFDEKEITTEEIVEEKVVTRKKKPKPEQPEEFKVTLQEPQQIQPEPEEAIAEVVLPVQKPQPEAEEFEVELKITEPQHEDHEVVVKKKSKKKPIEKSVEVVEDVVNVVEAQPEEQKEEDIVVVEEEEKVEESQPKSFEFQVTETEAPQKKPAEVIEEKPKEKVKKPAPKVEEKFDSYEISIKESEAEKVIQQEEQPTEDIPDEVTFTPLPKQPEQVEAEFVMTEPKPTEESHVEAEIKPKKTKKPKKTEEAISQDVKVVEEVAAPEEIVVEEQQIEIVEKETVPVEETPKEYKIRVSDSQIEQPEEPTAAEFTVKKAKPSIAATEEPEAEFVLKESKPVEEVTEVAEIKTKKPKKKAKEVAAEELKIQITEETPQEVPVVEEIEEVVEEIKETVPTVEYKSYEIGVKETEAEKPAEAIVVEEPLVEEPQIEEAAPTIEYKSYKIGVKESVVEKPIEKAPSEEQLVEEPIAEEPETFEELKVRVIEETPREIVEEVLEESVKVHRKKKPKPEVTEEPEAQVSIPAPTSADEVEAVQSVTIVPEVPTEEEAAELKITVIDEVSEPQELVHEIEEIETVDEVPEPVPEEKPKDYQFSIKESEAPKETIEELPEEQITIPKKKKVQEQKEIVEELPEEQFTIQKKKKPVPEVVEEPEAVFEIKQKQPVEEVTEEAKIKKKSKKPVKQDEAAAELSVTVIEESAPEPEVLEIVEEIEEKPAEKPEEKPVEQPIEYQFTVKESQPEAPAEVETEDIQEVQLPKKTPKVPEVTEEPEAEVTLKPKPKTEEVQEEVKVSKKKPKPKAVEEAAEELTVKVIEEVAPEPVVVEQEVVEEVEIKKPEKPTPEEIVDDAVFKIKKPKAPEEDEEVVAEVTLKPKAPKEVQEEDFSVDVKLPTEKKVTEETSDQTVQLKKKKKPQKPAEEAADELQLTQTVIEERPVEIEEEEVVEEAVVIRRKPKKPFEPTVEDLEETEFSLSFKKPHTVTEGVEEAATVLKKRPVKPQTLDEAGAELSIKRLEEEYEEGDDVEEFVVSQRPKPKQLQITDEEDQEYTIKKLKRRKKVDIPEFTDVENVTFRAKSTKTKEDVDQEFNIALDSYAEEEVSMSGKVKLKKPIKKTYSEATDEARIKILQDYDDGEGPIIEEIHDDEDTIDEVEEPEEYMVEELPPDEVDFKLKPKKQPKPHYSVQDEEEEQFLIGLRHAKRDSITYDEDSLTFKKKRKVVQQLFNEDGASLNITREMDVDESQVENIMYSICNYIADNDEAINLVEGEKVQVIGRHSSEWWYVKKSITEEEGWVPAQYLMEPAEYAQYVQNKLHEKIDKLPVFERPGPQDKPIAPRFIEKLQPIHTPDGYTVQFECKVEGNPRPQIAWFRETAIIKPSQDFQMFYDEDNVATLIIREVFPEDAGKFTCVAKNAAGFTSSTTELIVESPLSDHGSDATALSRRSMSRESSMADILEGIPPTFSRKPKAQYVDEGTNVILECRLVAVPEPDIVWTFNGEDIDEEETKNVRIVTESDMHMYCSVVHITKVKKSQEGVYEVIATNREGEARLPITLKVRTSDKEAPQILEPLRNMVIREGESVVLSTQIVGNPAPKVTWYKDGKPIKNAKSDKDLHTLTLITPKKSEKGEYTVKAVNPLGSVETTAYLTIEEPTSGNAEPPLFVERFEEQSVPQKGEIHLPAKVSGNPVPEVQWLFNNNPLFTSERIQQIYDGENIELIIKDANPETDSGDYKCIASNPIGKTSHGARVIVEVDEVTFTKKLKKTITIEEVQSLTLECETSHVVSTKWFFNGKELSGMDHRVVVEDGKTHKLVIRNTNLRDSGTYVCKVKKQETQSTVEVLQRKPDFLKVLEDYEVTEKDTAILDVELTTEAVEVTWYKDGEKITPENKNCEFIKDGKSRRLVIRDSTIHDEGEYTCKLEGQECSAELTVIELPPEIVKHLEDVNVTKGENAVFDIELSKGDALVKWFKNGKEIKFNERIQLAIDGKKQSLRILKAKPEDAGEYTIQVGDQVSKAKLTVEEPLVDFVLRLPDVTLATKTTDAEFTVELSQPDVEVTWHKKGKPIKPNKKHEVFVEGTVRRLVIHDADDDDAGEISCVAENVTSSSKLCVEELKLPPVITSDKDQTIKVKENEDATFTVKYTGAPTPEAEWTSRKVVIPKSKRTIPTIDEQSATLTIKKVVDDDEGEYTVKLVNPVGEAEASLHLLIMRKPTAPGTPQPLEVMHDSITLYWKAPEDDGKSEIIEYILEYHDVKEEKWTEIRKIKDTTYTISKLKIDTEYVFRSIAVNEVGPSPPSPISSPIRLVPKIETEAPSVREPLQDIVSDLNKEVTMSCVFGGIPEPTVTWKKNGQVFESSSLRYENRVAKYTIEKTTIETEATYTCVATNEKGSVETSCRLKLQQKPTVEIEDKYLSQKLRTGSTLTIPATVRGYPQPTVTWHKETVEQKSTKEVTIETTETSSTYTIKKVTREHSGRYKVTASNESGSSYAECTVQVIDKPSRPQSLEVKDVKKDSIILEWTPPVDDGGMEIKQYTLEKCDLQNKVWMKVSDFDKDINSYAIQKLSMNAQYMFRVVAVNPIGESEPTESEPVTITKKFEKPTPPRDPTSVSGMNDTSFTLSWEPSESDGGSKIIEYIVEIREETETVYRSLGTTTGTVTNIHVENVVRNKGYLFRIYARNEVGTSDAFETTEKIVVGRKITPPSPPQNLRAPDVTSRSVTLDWEVPARNGGSEITGYCVEKRSSTSTSWTKVITLDAHQLHYTIDNLKDKCEYWFRVSAENEVGLGAPAVTESISLKTHATVPSPPTAPLEARVLAANAHVFEWGIPESDGGAPLLGYHIAIRDMKKSMWIEVGRVPAGVQKFQIRDLQENHEYMIRILAKNEIGLSEPLESEEPYKVMTAGHASLPDEPRTEMSTCNTSSWLRDHNMDADIHSYARGRLLQRDEYFFRLWAQMPKKKKGSK
ncbi:hypothetical protein AWZ03_009416, partial [Drosophila navojoa]